MLTDLGIGAKKAERVLMTASSEIKNKALEAIAKALIDNTAYIEENNALDIKNAKANGMSESMIDRLSLNADRIRAISEAVLQVASLDDPCGKVMQSFLCTAVEG